MGGFDTLISAVIVLSFIIFVGSKIYGHEKEHIKPLIKKIKSWFIKEDGENDLVGPNDDFEIAFRGQVADY